MPECRDGLLGLIFGLVIGLATILGGFYCIVQGFSYAATALDCPGLPGWLVPSSTAVERREKQGRRLHRKRDGVEV